MVLGVVVLWGAWAVLGPSGAKPDRTSGEEGSPVSSLRESEREKPETGEEGRIALPEMEIAERDARTEIPDDAARRAVLRVRDEAGVPIPTANARWAGHPEPLGADGEGTITLQVEELDAHDRKLLVLAAGYGSRLVRLPPLDQVVVLADDVPFLLEIVWDDSGEPVVGAAVRHRHLLGTPAWWLDGMYASLDREWTTDSSGLVEVPFPWRGDRFIRYVQIEIEHPDGGRLLVDTEELGDPTPPEASGASSTDFVQRIALPRLLPCIWFEFRDVEGRVLGGREVQFEPNGEVALPETTDEEGRVLVRLQVKSEYLDPAVGYFVTIDLGAGRTWVHYAETPLELDSPSEVLVTTAFRDIVVRVDHANPAVFSAATAMGQRYGRDHPGRPPLFWCHPSSLKRFGWVQIGANGRAILSSGFQGSSTVLLVRHDPSGMIVAWEEVGPRTEVTVAPGDDCLLTIQASDGATSAPGVLELSPCTADGDDFSEQTYRRRPRVPLSSLPVALTIPQGTYRTVVFLGDSSSRLPEIAALEAAVTATLELPTLAEVRGEIRGSLSGPIENASIMPSRSGLRSDRHGAFLLQLPMSELEETGIYIDMPDGFPSVRVSRSSLPTDLDAEIVTIEREEAKLVLHQDPASPLAGIYPVGIVGRPHGGAGPGGKIHERI